MNTQEKTKSNPRAPKFFQRRVRTSIRIKKTKKQGLSKPIFRRKRKIVKRVAKTNPTRQFAQTICQFQGFLETQRRLAQKFDRAVKGAFFVEGVRIKRGERKDYDDLEKVLEERALKMVEDSRRELNQRKAKVCSNCCLSAEEFFKRVYRMIICFSYSNYKRFSGTQVDGIKLKNGYFSRIRSELRDECEAFEDLIESLQQEHTEPGLVIVAYHIEGPKELIFQNSFERSDDYLPQRSEMVQNPGYLFHAQGQNIVEYLHNLQRHLEEQRERVLLMIDHIEAEETNSEEIGQSEDEQ